MRAVLLAGGKGTRLGKSDIPKPMVEVGGIPVLEHQIRLLKSHQFYQVTVLASYKAERIEEYFGDGAEFGVDLEIVKEDPPLGTAGAVKAFAKCHKDPFLVIYSDLMVDIDLTHLVEFHKSRESLATLVVHPNDHPLDSDLVEIDDEAFVKQFFAKPHAESAGRRNLVNAAVYVLDPSILEMVPENEPSDFGRDIFPRVVKSGGKIRAYLTTEYVKDMGTRERLAAVTRDFQAGKISRMNRGVARKVCFLDRDGVINKEVGDLSRTDQLSLIPGASTSIRRLNQNGFLVIVVTNQPNISRGKISKNEVIKMNNIIKEKTEVDDFFICYHDDIDNCSCRKPKPGLLLQASIKWNIDFNKSYLIGDRWKDIEAGKKVKCKTIFIDNKYGETKHQSPTYISYSLFDAAQIIKKNVSKK